MPGASHRHSVVVREPVDTLWNRLQSARTWAAIGPVDRVWDADHGDDGALVGFRWSTTVGSRPYEGSARTAASDKPRRMQLELDSSELSGRLTASLEPRVDGCRVEVAMEFENRGLLATLFFPAISAAVADGLRRHLEAFASAINEGG